MVTFWRVYRFVRLVKKTESPKVTDCKKEFKTTKHRWFLNQFTEEQVEEYIELAEKRQFLHKKPDNGGDLSFKIDVDGKKLLRFPVGTIQCFLEELGLFVSLVISILIAFSPLYDDIWNKITQ